MSAQEILKPTVNKAILSPCEDASERYPIVSIGFFVKLRDAAQMIVDAANEQLDQSSPFDDKVVQPYDPNSLGWIRTEGQKGPYERYPAFQQKPTSTFDYNNLLIDLKNHDGKLVRNGLFYWLWDDEQTIGRKTFKTK